MSGDLQRFAQAVVDLYEAAGYDGLADEMSLHDIEKSNRFYAIYEEARGLIQQKGDQQQ